MAREYLLFRLWGPLASWGEVAVGEVRGSAIVPTRSALLGLLAAALGLDRADDESHAELGRALRFGVLVEAAGVPLTDYHTAQLAPPRRGRVNQTRAEELGGPRHGLRTILSRREYRCDALYRVAAWREEAPSPPSRWSLHELAQALDRPTFVPYLGRKACPLGLPLGARRVHAESLPEAMASPEPEEVAAFFRALGLERRLRTSSPRLYWEGDAEVGEIEAETRAVRRDDPRSRTRWTFRGREELSAAWIPSPSAVPEATEGRPEEAGDVPE